MIAIYKAGNTEKLQECLGKDLYTRQSTRRHLCVPLKERAYFLAFCWCNMENTRTSNERQCIYCSAEDFLFFGDSPRCIKIVQAMPKDAEPFQVLIDFFFQLTGGDVDRLERFENSINELELSILQTEKPMKGVSLRIIEMRRSLLKIKRYYEQLGTVTDRLAENENGLIPQKLVPRCEALNRHIHYLIKSVTELREFVTQVREAYQAQIDIEQNQIMKIFTVITGIFLPLTLIVGWYGMNFQIPELGWQHGYLYVTLLSLGICGFSCWMFKRKKWF